ncbi:MAG: hypothetical protein IT364_07610 [Candidatus Hydrogenedentes bacterium]|nr:hypothetical protein [Candidatus Hydrogenedentota bacterium]
MKTRSVLVYCPGYPFDPEALMPSRTLAAAAGSLLEAGHVTHIRDYGTVECVERLVGGKVGEAAKAVAESLVANSASNPLQTLHALWRVRAADRAFRVRMKSLACEIADGVANLKGLHFAALMMNVAEDVEWAALIARRLRASRPKLRILAFGRIPELYGESLLRHYPVFDCLCAGDIEFSLLAFAEKAESPQTWHSIPNLLLMEPGGPCAAARSDGGSLGGLPAPAYEPDVYPALRAEQKLKLFGLEDNRGAGVFGHAFPRAGGHAGVRMKPVVAVCNEMWRVATLYGARAFSLCGGEAPASHMAAVAHEIVRRGMNVVYSRMSNVRGVAPAVFPTLSASGCVAMSFRIDTGSQRLLDDFYGRGITVTEIESVLHGAKKAGLYTIARFTYPCPEDDYHTHAESLRLIERVRPHVAPVEIPELLPTSRWYESPGHFGYSLSCDDLVLEAVRCARKFPLPENVWRSVPQRVGGLSTAQVIAAQQELIADIESRGIVASVPEKLARLARLAGYSEREREFGRRVQEEFLRGDTAGIATLVDQFNEVACVPAKGVALRPFDSQRIAVGN